MQVVLYRIDERLIHGQVMALWLGKTGANTVVIVDELAAKDTFMQQIYRMAAPANVSVDVVGYAKFREMVSSSDGTKAIILFKGPNEAYEALKEGVEAAELIVGNISTLPGRKKLSKYAYMSDDEIGLMADLQTKGWSVNIQLLPNDSKSPIGK